MTVTVGKVDRYNVQDVIAELLMNFSSDTAFDRLSQEARYAKQTLGEVAYRTAGNLLRSSVTRKRYGEVVVP